MAKKTKKSRKNSKPNVFKQTTATNTTIDTNNEVSLLENKPSNKKVNSSNDQVYVSGNSVSLELKKMGIISSSLLVILIILTFILG
ncbi:MAG: hypothetical protein EGP06_01925 [SAR202 cluster bacterium]|jgi:hypothetical protein|nr:MAG: hypothetical protein EGP06_01925 [SAR202 cluster bacterium]|tara:strand:+ start:40 stop:297 length:258 start_codon:yes stop_codon:yes gene_type:complete